MVELLSKNGWTFLDAEVRLRLGIHIRPSMMVCDSSSNYNGEVYLINYSRGDRKRRNCKSIMALILLTGNLRGDRIRFEIEGTGPPAEKLARDLYRIVSARDYEELEMIDGKQRLLFPV